MENQRAAELERFEELHEVGSREAHDEIDSHQRSAAAREEGAEDMIVDVPLWRERIIREQIPPEYMCSTQLASFNQKIELTDHGCCSYRL